MGVQLITFVRKIVAGTIAYIKGRGCLRGHHTFQIVFTSWFSRGCFFSHRLRAMITLEFLSPKLAFRSSSSWWLEKKPSPPRSSIPNTQSGGPIIQFRRRKRKWLHSMTYFFPIVSIHLANRKVESGCWRFVFPLCPRHQRRLEPRRAKLTEICKCMQPTWHSTSARLLFKAISAPWDYTSTQGAPSRG